MRKSDLKVRIAARDGDASAAAELARTYICGAPGIASDHRQALTYIAGLQEIPEDLLILAVDAISLDVFVAAGTMAILRRGLEVNSAAAKRKVMLHAALLGDEVAFANVNGDEAGLAAIIATEPLTDSTLSHLLPDAQNNSLWRTALSYLLTSGRHESAPLTRAVFSVLRETESGTNALAPLNACALYPFLSRAATAQNAFALFVLGSCELGLAVGNLSPKDVVFKASFRAGYARLLRAAHMGKRQAWLQLSRACSNHRSVVANSDAAAFFLEQAAKFGVPLAQAILGARQLISANDSAGASRALELVIAASEAGVGSATSLLATLNPPLANSDDDQAEQIVRRLSQFDSSLAFRLLLSREFKLTIDQAATIDISATTHPSGIAFGRGKSFTVVPAATKRSRELLAQIAKLVDDSRAKNVDLGYFKTTIYQFLKRENIPFKMFFADTPSLRSFQNWRSENIHLLRLIAEL